MDLPKQGDKMVIETKISTQGGHALVYYDGEEQTVIVYSDTEMRLEANEKAVKDVKDVDKVFPQLAELY